MELHDGSADLSAATAAAAWRRLESANDSNGSNDGFLTPLVPNLPSNTRWFASPTAGLPFFGSRNLALYIRFDNWNGGNTRLLSVDNADTLMD